MRKSLQFFFLALGIGIGVCISAIGESRLIPPIGTTQPVADSLYVNETGDEMTGPLKLPNGTKTAPGLAFYNGVDAWDTGIYNVAAKGASIMYFTVNDTTVANCDSNGVTYTLDYYCNGSARFGDAVGDALIIKAGTWTSENAVTWHIDGDTTFDASGKTVSLDGTWSMANDAYFTSDVNAGLTASTTQSQGQGALTAEVNEVATCANNNDVVTLPTAVVGRNVVVINNGAKTLQIFPASGDDLGAGVDTSTTLSSDSNVTYQAYDVTNWESM